MKRFATLLALCGLSGLSISCGSEEPERLDTLPPVTAKAGGLTLLTPIVRGIPVGKDATYCTFTDVITKDKLLLHNTGGAQSPGGHHAILFYTPVPEAPRTIPCEAADMERFRQVIGGTGGEGTAVWEPTPNVAAEIPAGVQLIVQHHWINYTDKPLDAQAVIVTEPAEMRADTVLAGATAVVATNFRIPAMGQFQGVSECEFKQRKRYLMGLPHQHEWGKHVKVELVRAGGATETIIDTDFEPSMVFEPPVTDFERKGARLTVEPGDKIRLSCDWKNTNAEPLEFPREMCVFFGYSDDGETAYCTNGEWD
ncbi:MAG: hypothetical protein IT370_32470 [Deltaproteobacteria bacterium]|nr:hypothetical protein [Deltaproteobacteria bacterium]